MSSEKVLNKVRPEMRLSARSLSPGCQRRLAMPDSPFHPHAATTC
jgi:hypothetical protein